MNNDIIKEDCEKIIETFCYKELNNKDVLITGSSGLIGTYFLFSLNSMVLKGKIKIKNIYAVIYSELPEYLNELKEYAYIHFLKGDLEDMEFVQKLPKADYIIHAAGYAQPGRFMVNPLKTIRLNTNVTDKLVAKLNTNGKFLFISTSEVYSGSINVPYKESNIGNTTPQHPRACYIEGKRCGEAIVNAAREQGINIKSARLSLAYGPGVRKNDKRVLYNFIQKANMGKIELLDAGEAVRTYIYVSDAVELLYKILLWGKEPVYNVGGESHISIRNLAEKIADIKKVPVELPEKIKKMEGAPENVWLDMSKTNQLAGKTQYIPMEIGLKRTIQWMDYYL